jgi:transcriptional regulator with XRE-family HTH domain
VARYEPDRLVRDIGRRVAELRRERGLTKQALASKLRATMQWVQQIEYGANLTVHSLARVANALDIQLDALLDPPSPSSYLVRQGRPPRDSEGKPARRERTPVAAEPPRRQRRGRRRATET